jgi:hypothetical protein
MGTQVALSRLGQREGLSPLDAAGLCEVYGNPTSLSLGVDGTLLREGDVARFPAGRPPVLELRYEWRGVAEPVDVEIASDREGVVFSGTVRPELVGGADVVLGDLAAGAHELTVRVRRCEVTRTLRAEVAPSLRIVTPSEGETRSYGRALRASAEVFGLGASGTLTWRLDGRPLPEAEGAEVVFEADVGRHRLEVEGNFPNGARLTDQATFTLTNASPTVSIATPTGSVCTNEDVPLRAEVFDADQAARDLAVEWSFEGRRVATGATATARFAAPATGTLSVRVVDDLGESATDTAPLVVEGCGAQPSLTVRWPASTDRPIPPEDYRYGWDDFDRGSGYWYVDVRPTATAEDAEDGRLTGSAIEWVTDRTDLQPALLGTGEQPTLRLRGMCTGDRHTITVRATDSDGNVRTRTFVVAGWRLC